eukprot:scaffold2277_cov256-Pinguiococcus_pyrenoidosus.AAC.10
MRQKSRRIARIDAVRTLSQRGRIAGRTDTIQHRHGPAGVPECLAPRNGPKRHSSLAESAMSPPSHEIAIFAVTSAFKLLLSSASYHSTDLEVHRNWLSITAQSPLRHWYFESTSQWTLDYPPLFAYFQWLLQLVAQVLHPGMLQLSAEPIADGKTLLFQRLSVIVSDAVLLAGNKLADAGAAAASRAAAGGSHPLSVQWDAAGAAAAVLRRPSVWAVDTGRRSLHFPAVCEASLLVAGSLVLCVAATALRVATTSGYAAIRDGGRAFCSASGSGLRAADCAAAAGTDGSATAATGTALPVGEGPRARVLGAELLGALPSPRPTACVSMQASRRGHGRGHARMGMRSSKRHLWIGERGCSDNGASDTAAFARHDALAAGPGTNAVVRVAVGSEDATGSEAAALLAAIGGVRGVDRVLLWVACAREGRAGVPCPFAAASDVGGGRIAIPWPRHRAAWHDGERHAVPPALHPARNVQQDLHRSGRLLVPVGSVWHRGRERRVKRESPIPTVQCGAEHACLGNAAAGAAFPAAHDLQRLGRRSHGDASAGVLESLERIGSFRRNSVGSRRAEEMGPRNVANETLKGTQSEPAVGGMSELLPASQMLDRRVLPTVPLRYAKPKSSSEVRYTSSSHS